MPFVKVMRFFVFNSSKAIRTTVLSRFRRSMADVLSDFFAFYSHFRTAN